MKTAGIESDGRTVWVAAAVDGSCIGRFGMMGIDIHRSMTDQIAGLGECLLCTHGMTTVSDWETFTRGMRDLHGVVVPEGHMPKRLRATVPQ